MQTATALVALGNDIRNTVDITLTPAEAAVVEALHGIGSVSMIKFIADIERTKEEDKERILRQYLSHDPDTRQQVARMALADFDNDAYLTFKDAGFDANRFVDGKFPPTKKTVAENKEVK